jgi:glycosyltransferase involved in cell wall biosynthesis
MKNISIRICYFGIYAPTAPRDKVYLEGLKKLGVEVIECVDNSPGFSKFFRLWRKHRVIRNDYDILWVGYLSTLVLPLAWLISRKKIVFNSLSSWYETTILDRESHGRFSLKAIFIWLLDFLAFRLSGMVLLESEQQKIFIAKKFFVNPAKLQVVFTGVDETIFHPDSSVPKAKDFTVVFRGLFLPATGAEFVLETARILKDTAVKFIVIGWGEPLQTKFRKAIQEEKLTNVTLITHFLPADELRTMMLSAHVMLGQFAGHKRMERTIQNKNFEALALGMPLITRDSPSNRELLTDEVNCLFVSPENSQAIAEKIMATKDSPALRESLSSAGLATFNERCRGEVLASNIFQLLWKF